MLKITDCFNFSTLSREEIQHVLDEHHITLTVKEVLNIQKNILKRPLTLAECQLWSVVHSERYCYKSTKHLLQEIPTKAMHIVLGSTQGVGIVAIAIDSKGERYDVVLGHQSHDHLLQWQPYESASAIVAENIGDVASMGAEIVATSNSMRFGEPDNTNTQNNHLAVVQGLSEYANSSGVATIAGDVYYDESYNQHCLLSTVTLGTLKEDAIIYPFAPKGAEDYDLILVGRPTDNNRVGYPEGFDQEKSNKVLMQETDALFGRHLLKAHYALFDWLKSNNLMSKVAFKGLTLGGIGCAMVEIVQKYNYGVKIDLDQVQLSMPKLDPATILCSQTHERYIWAVPSKLSEEIIKHYNKTYDLAAVYPGSQASIIGKITKGGQYHASFQGEIVVEALFKDLTNVAAIKRPIREPDKKLEEPVLSMPEDLNDVLLRLLSHENIASREMVYENFDKQVQGRTVIEAGVADAGLIQLFDDDSFPKEIHKVGVALAINHNPRYSKIDAYWGAVNAIAQATRKVSCVGALPWAITYSLNAGNPEEAEQMWQVNQAAEGIRDACQDFYLQDNPEQSLAVASGNVFLNNESSAGTITPSVTVSCLGRVDDIAQVISRGFKREDSCILLIGDRKDECGGSVYYQLSNHLGSQLPRPNIRESARQMYALHDAIERGLVFSAHSIGKGGVAVALAKMSIENMIGVAVEIPSVLAEDKLLFSETGGLILEVSRENRDELETLFAHYRSASVHVGFTTETKRLKIQNNIDLSVVFAKKAFEQGLREKIL